MATQQGFFIVLLSIHGLIRSKDLELGRDADTGGQTKYVVELLKALSVQPQVVRVVLLTRRIQDAAVSLDYAKPLELVNNKACIVRLECGGESYLRKENLWDSLDCFADNAMAWLKNQVRMPDVLHTHYADAGYVGARLSHQLGIPLIHTGHSLGMGKCRQLMASGMAFEEIEAAYQMRRRIEAEELTLSAADRIITSTQQEIELQYGLYDFYQPECMRVVPPGTDLEAFYPPQGNERDSAIFQELSRFLLHPEKPIILALSRPDPRKNITTLIRAYGESLALQELANLVIVAGNRDDIQGMEATSQQALNEILLAIDKYDLYGKVAYPKHHAPQDVSVLYRLAALSKGVFVNPALTEPFGLTLIEAAACGLPIVATEDGGPRDIIENCQNGYLVNPLASKAIAERLQQLLLAPQQWQNFAVNGMDGVKRHYSWPAHVTKYLALVQNMLAKTEPVIAKVNPVRRAHLLRRQAIMTSLDLSLFGDDDALAQLVPQLERLRKQVIWGVATGRPLNDALALLNQFQIPKPDLLICAQGAEIYHGSELVRDTAWDRHVNHHWYPAEIQQVLADVPGLHLQPGLHQTPFKISYFVELNRISVAEVRQILARHEIRANLIFCFGQFLDIVPVRVSKGLALRWCAEQYQWPLENILAVGVTGADADMLRGNTLAAVLNSRHVDELIELAGVNGIYFTQQSCAAGILEAMNHYGFIQDQKS